MLLLISFILSLVSALLLVSLFKFKHWADWLIALFLIIFSETVLGFEILGLFSAIRNIPLYLIFQFSLSIILFRIWLLKGKPDPFLNVKLFRKDMVDFWRFRNKHPVLIIFAGCLIIFWLFNAWLIITVPPNTSDSLSTHLARVIHWLQNGSFRPWETKITWQVVYPFNAQLQFLWFFLFTSSDRLVGFVQFASGLVSFLAIYRIGLFFSWPKSRSLFAAMIWAVFPEILLQSTSTQNDLVLAALLTSCILFLFIGIKEISITYLVFSGLSLGLALGTKQTMLFLIPGFGLALIFIVTKFRKTILKSLIIWSVASLVSFVFLGSFIYIQNLIYFHSPAGPSEKVEGQMNEFSFENVSDELPVNISRLIYQSVDPSGLPGNLPGYMQKFKAKLVEFAGLRSWMESDVGIVRIFNLRDLPPTHEDSAWFGLTSVLLLFPTLVFQLFTGIRKKEPFRTWYHHDRSWFSGIRRTPSTRLVTLSRTIFCSRCHSFRSVDRRNKSGYKILENSKIDSYAPGIGDRRKYHPE